MSNHHRAAIGSSTFRLDLTAFLWQREGWLLVTENVAPRSAAVELAGLLESPEIADLIRELEATRWTGRPGYPIRSLIGMALAKSLYAIPTWTRTVRLVREHAALHAAVGGDVPSEWACYRFTRKLREHKACLTVALTGYWPGWLRTARGQRALGGT